MDNVGQDILSLKDYSVPADVIRARKSSEHLKPKAAYILKMSKEFAPREPYASKLPEIGSGCSAFFRYKKVSDKENNLETTKPAAIETSDVTKRRRFNIRDAFAKLAAFKSEGRLRRFRKDGSPAASHLLPTGGQMAVGYSENNERPVSILPVENAENNDFAANVEEVRRYGWYWSSLSGEDAEILLRNEKSGSFLVRDSTDQRYLFSLSFKLDGVVRHVRIDHFQGSYSFGGKATFKSSGIVDFIESAVFNSRSGNYMFFLQRRPSRQGPVRVQLLYPVSRFDKLQSLQAICRDFISGRMDKKDIATLSLPSSAIDYLLYRR